jgi:hypothetical protein
VVHGDDAIEQALTALAFRRRRLQAQSRLARQLGQDAVEQQRRRDIEALDDDVSTYHTAAAGNPRIPAAFSEIIRSRLAEGHSIELAAILGVDDMRAAFDFIEAQTFYAEATRTEEPDNSSPTPVADSPDREQAGGAALGQASERVDPASSHVDAKSVPKGRLADVQRLWKVQGLTDSQIAESLDIGVKTVREYVRILRRDFGEGAAPRRRRGTT